MTFSLALPGPPRAGTDKEPYQSPPQNQYFPLKDSQSVVEKNSERRGFCNSSWYEIFRFLQARFLLCMTASMAFNRNAKGVSGSHFRFKCVSLGD